MSQPPNNLTLLRRLGDLIAASGTGKGSAVLTYPLSAENCWLASLSPFYLRKLQRTPQPLSMAWILNDTLAFSLKNTSPTFSLISQISPSFLTSPNSRKSPNKSSRFHINNINNTHHSKSTKISHPAFSIPILQPCHVFSERFLHSSRSRAGFRSMPQAVMSGALMLSNLGILRWDEKHGETKAKSANKHEIWDRLIDFWWF